MTIQFENNWSFKYFPKTMWFNFLSITWDKGNHWAYIKIIILNFSIFLSTEN